MALAFFSGILICLSFPKWNLWFLAWVALIPLFYAIENLSFKKSFFLGWLTGTTAFCGILYWIVPTFQAAGVHIFVGVLSTFLLASYVGLYLGLFAGISQKFSRKFPFPFYLISSCALWVALEYARSHLFTGFPWGLLGYSQWKVPFLIQISEWTAVYGVSAIIIFFNLWMGTTLPKWSRIHFYSFLVYFIFLVVNLILLMDSKKFKSYRNERLSVAVLQGNIDQYKKWDSAFVKEILQTYRHLSEKACRQTTQSPNRLIAQAPSLIVWPETALPGWLLPAGTALLPQEKWLAEWTEETVKKTGTCNLIGAVTRENGKNYNSAFLFDAGGKNRERYDKIHLVPFGEFVPFQSYLGRWIGVLNELGGFYPGKNQKIVEIPIKPPSPPATIPSGRQPSPSRGEEVKVRVINGMTEELSTKLGVSICYEAIFPELIRKQVFAGAEILVNMTNDGWYLDTAAPEQHFSMNVFRAVENRRYLVRAANTGISGVILPDGSLPRVSKLNEKIVISSTVEPSQKKTFYTLYGNLFAWLCCGISLVGILFSLRSSEKKDDSSPACKKVGN